MKGRGVSTIELADVGRLPAEPVRVPIARFGWQDVAFVHHRIDAEAVQRVLPAGLTVEEFDGSAWVSLTPFRVTGARIPGIPLGYDYLEANLRTYVRSEQGRRGIWFLALDASSMFACLLGRGAFFQPYDWTRIAPERREDWIRYRGERRFPHRGSSFDVVLEIGDEITPDPLDDFLTGRWLLFTRYGPALAAAAVEHAPWPLRAATATVADAATVFEAAGLPVPRGEPLAHFSAGVDAKLGPPKPVRPRSDA